MNVNILWWEILNNVMKINNKKNLKNSIHNWSSNFLFKSSDFQLQKKHWLKFLCFKNDYINFLVTFWKVFHIKKISQKVFFAVILDLIVFVWSLLVHKNFKMDAAFSRVFMVV